MIATQLHRRLTCVVSILLASFLSVYSQQPRYNIADTMVGMRDGVKLNTQVFTPTNTAEKYPILLLRTPYGIGKLTSEQLTAALPELSADGYRHTRISSLPTKMAISSEWACWENCSAGYSRQPRRAKPLRF